MKLIALDVGTKRIGVAKADSAVRIAVPFPAVEVDGNEFKKIASLARAWDINSFVLGLPRNSQGEETEQSRYKKHRSGEKRSQIGNSYYNRNDKEEEKHFLTAFVGKQNVAHSAVGKFFA